MSEVTTSDAADVKPAVETETKPMTEKDFLSSRIAKLSAKAPKPEAAQSESAPQEETPKASSPSQEGEPKPKEASPKEVLSKDVEDLTDEEIAELAQKGKSGLLKRIAELTAKRKLAEEKAAALEAAIQHAQRQLPETKIENNPYASIDSEEALMKEKSEVDSFVEFAEDVLFRSEDLGADDVAYEADGKQYSKAAVREMLRNAKRRQTKFIPAQYAELQERAKRSAMEENFKKLAKQELSWLDGEDNDTRKRFEAMVNDPRLKKMKESVPEIAPQIEYLVAHAANSIYGRKLIDMDSKPKSPAINPPSTPSTTAAAPERTESRAEKTVKDIESRFKQTGSASDFIALRAAQISKRKS
jgi:hypothetical protein